jgi:hypothetical protein
LICSCRELLCNQKTALLVQVYALLCNSRLVYLFPNSKSFCSLRQGRSAMTVTICINHLAVARDTPLSRTHSAETKAGRLRVGCLRRGFLPLADLRAARSGIGKWASHRKPSCYHEISRPKWRVSMELTYYYRAFLEISEGIGERRI